jgi:hypothetical protein
MTISLTAGSFVVVREQAARARGLAVEQLKALAGSAQQADGLIVLGPTHSAEGVGAALSELGLVYPDDYFDCDESGGTFPPWCLISIQIRRE